ncbi:MAG: hypothetical protein ACXW09_11930 [Methylococcaceae bacterium]
MFLSDLIHKNRPKPIANANPANFAKDGIEPDKPAILRWLHSIGETDHAVIDDVLHYCASNPEALAYYLKRAGEVPPPDDRHHCRECLNLRNGYCIKQRVRSVDDMPRRCGDFAE